MVTDTPYGAYPVRRRAVVQHAVRPRRDHHGARVSVDEPEPRSRRAVVPRRDAGDGGRRRAATRSPARSCTRCARGEMAALGEIPFGRYYGSHDATPLFVVLAAAYYGARATAISSPGSGRRSRPRSRWIERDGDARRRRLRRVRARVADRPRAPGLEGLARLGLPRRRRARRGADRALRDSGLRLRGVARRRDAGRACWDTRARPHEWAREGGRVASPLRAAFWCDELGTYVLALDGRKRPCAGARLERRAGAVHRHRRAAIAPAPWRAHARSAGELFGLGHPHARDERGALQPDVVPQRIDLAARQRPDRRRLRALRASQRRVAAGSLGPLRRQRVRWICIGCRSCSAASRAGPARARRSIPSPAIRRPGRRRGVPAAAGRARAGGRRRPQRRRQVHARPTAAAFLDEVAHPQPARRPARSIFCSSGTNTTSASACCAATATSRSSRSSERKLGHGPGRHEALLERRGHRHLEARALPAQRHLRPRAPGRLRSQKATLDRAAALGHRHHHRPGRSLSVSVH